MNILAVDTSSKTASVCILKDNRIVAENFCNALLTHSQTFMVMVENALEISKTEISEIDYFAITKGPGSFTGLRIGIGGIKAMAQVLKKPCVGVSSLEALAYNVVFFDGIICPVMDARCNQVYTALFRSCGGNLERIMDDAPMLISELGDKLSEYSEKIYFVGCGADLTFDALKDKLNNIEVVPEVLKFQRASAVAACAKKYVEKDECITDAFGLELSYLRLPQAQRELIKKTQK
ncbi:MAG: tRNA (adenosine(37)-N6)-threonylcarbamoyltransferase complex dimerization subunit type 1 TsaB [Oscillospiraceae bacterium]